VAESKDYERSYEISTDRPRQLRRLSDALNLNSNSILSHKVKQIIETMVNLWQSNGGYFKRSDVGVIQDLIVAEISPEEFKQIAILSFATWATPARLSGVGLPHINSANQCIAECIAALVRAMEEKTSITVLDLGAGLLGTTESIAEALVPLSVNLHVTAVESSPELLEVAHSRGEKLLNYSPNLQIKILGGDMLDYLRAAPSSDADFITCAFAIHHLHPVDQLAMLVEAYRVLKSTGALFIADPQEGKSDFNLKELIYEEPEAVFAAFTSPDTMRNMLKDAGFTSIEVLLRDDSGYQAYVICGQS
jgi:SAM-dependent methyltransferase